MKFISVKDGIMSLKKLEQAKNLGGTKRSLSVALSQFVRHAWSEYSPAVLYSLYLTLVSKNNQAGKVRLPGQISGISQTFWLIADFSWTPHFSILTGCK